MPRLADLIKEEIKTNGPITFARFMEQALYHPELGYYTSPGTQIGRTGDFYTAPTVSPLFGAVLARQFHEMWRLAGCPSSWALVEYGPGTGVLARDITSAVYRNHPEFRTALDYYLIEISPALRKCQQNELNHRAPAGAVFKWVNNLADIDPAGIEGGCVFANELVDAFPVHLVEMGSTGLQELYVNLDSTAGFTFVAGPLSSADLANYFDMQNITLASGQKAEVNLQARKWLAEVAASLRQGFLLTVDYGATTAELYVPQRFNGTLRCFHKHRLVEDPFINIGRQDITAHVNFAALALWGEQLGLQKLGLVTQPQFLLNLGILDVLRRQEDFTYNPEIAKITSAIKQLVLPGGMGGIFKVLALSKGFDPVPSLSGFKRKLSV
ncbi:class I SAM-dependent methyltransferase [Desulfoscipio geothermicus]|uniref:SAM-dependent methyltransferase, MidA family n=1 Tax=Desulfoscipio geothermicus DSM 3669 TaxID=1121426 RepID=A0A1I6DXC5_9FIRM|nr:SAM-dependent methyltransferase [Desulfoscipio geothermicus]SFR10076.1 SAM-dependent methyltransferase, MidA family [Desulfoscipio geothermicus DSM 3669]